jgi:hypothetical protein
MHSWGYIVTARSRYAPSLHAMDSPNYHYPALHHERNIPKGTSLEFDHPLEVTHGSCEQEMPKQKLKEGYTLVKHRTVTGEQTVALYRGPLVPRPVPHPLYEGFGIQLNVGSDLETLDAEVGLMNISYSTAWLLGKQLAVGDASYAGALARLRRDMHTYAARKSVEVHKYLAADLGRLLAGLDDMNTNLRTMDTTDVNLQSGEAAHTLNISEHGTSSKAYEVPGSADSSTVHSWITDKIIHLTGIPPQHFIPNPSDVPAETLRAFYIDKSWIDACIDGALSVANHVAGEDDYRSAVKHAIRQLFEERDQMPKYGVVMSLRELKQDGEVDVSVRRRRGQGDERKDDEQEGDILVQKRLGEDTVLYLLDCCPPELQSMRFVVQARNLEFSAISFPEGGETAVAFEKTKTNPSSEPSLPSPTTPTLSQLSTPALIPPNAISSTLRADRPHFDIRMYPREKLSYIPTMRESNPDLVVSITLDQKYRDASSTHVLSKLRVRIQRGDITSTSLFKPTLDMDYMVSSPAMLSNVRFNILASFERDDEGREYLVLDLVPRAGKGIPLKQISEASFILSSVHVLSWKKEDGAEALVTLETKYCGYDEVFKDFATVKMYPDPVNTEEA